MKKLSQITIVVLILAILATPIIALASSIENARYYATILISNNSTATTNIATTANISTTNFIDGGYLNSSANNCVMRTSSGADIAFMPGYTPDANPWCLWVPSIGANSYLNYILYTANSTGGKIRYFPGAGGMATADNATLELSDNFTIEQKGFVDMTSVGYQDTYLDFVRANSDWVDIPDHADFSFTDGLGNDKPFSITAWINLDDASDSSILCKSKAANREWVFQIHNLDDLRVKCYKQDGTADIGRDTDPITAYEGTWIHVAATYDGLEANASFNLYINGVDSDTTDTGAGVYAGMTNTATKISMGADLEGTGNFMDGMIAQVKVWSAELTPAQIVADYNGEYISTNLVAWYPINEGTGNPVDSSGNGHNSTANLADWVTGASTQIIQGGSLIYKPGAFLTYRSGSENTTSIVIGTAVRVTADGVASGEQTVKTAQQPVLEFDGTNDLVRVPYIAAYNTNTELTAMAWVKGIVNAHKQVITQYDWGTADRAWYIGCPNTTSFSVFISDDGSSNALNIKGYYSSIPAFDSTWHHVAFTFDNGTLTLFVDGVEDLAPTKSTDAAITTIHPSVADVMFGTYLNNNVPDGFVSCNVSDIRMYDQALSPANMLDIFNDTFTDTTDLIGAWELDEAAGGVVGDSSTNGNTGTITSASWGNELLRIYIDDTLEDAEDGASVPNNSSNWTFVENYSMLYMESHEIEIDGVQAQFIEWEYSDNFTDQSANNNFAIPSFRSASSDADVSANMTGFFPMSEARAPDYVLGEAPAFIDADALTGNVTGTFGTTPGAGTGTFPLASIIATMAAATDTPAQLPLLIIAGFIILTASLVVSAIMRRHGSGSLLVKIVAIAALMGIFVALGNFAIDFWMILVFLIIAISIAFASKQLGWT